jgi:hypothetical protein
LQSHPEPLDSLPGDFRPNILFDVIHAVQTKYILVAIAVAAALALISWLRSRSVTTGVTPSPQQVSLTELTDGERHVYDLLREAQGHAILTEGFVREGGDVKTQLTLDTNKTTVASLSINLSSLARKQKNDGLSDGAVKRGFTF